MILKGFLIQCFWMSKKIGLFGGSFDPPHLGHVHFSLQAIKLFNLDKVIWLISPEIL